MSAGTEDSPPPQSSGTTTLDTPHAASYVLGVLPGDRARGAHDAVAEGVHGAEHVIHLDPEDHVGLAQHGVAPERVVERMARGEIHAALHVEHGALQRL